MATYSKYKTAGMTQLKPAFKKEPVNEPPAGPDDKTSEDKGVSLYARIFGALKGTVTIAPGVNLTQPTGEKWNAEQ